MIGNILVALMVLWAAVYSAFKLKAFIKNAGSEKSVKCSCSSCPYMEK